MAKLDRVFVSDNWKVRFLLTQICSLQRPMSDHIPILLISGEIKQKSQKQFHFEKWWQVHNLIRESWTQHTRAKDTAGNITIKLRRLRKVLKKWEWRFRDGGRNEKDEIMTELEILKKLEESRNLSLDENSRVL